MPDEHSLVDSGSFRIDRKRALEKLMRFQLQDARMYPLPWIQAAVASGATFIRVWPLPSGFDMAFDGMPWTPEELRDIYRHLFEEDPDGSKTRLRELAVGVLSALRVQPQHISITFAHDGAEPVLHIKSLMEERLETGAGESLFRYGPDTKMSIYVGMHASYAKELAHIKRLCAHSPVPIEIAHYGGESTKLGGEPDEVPAGRVIEGEGVRGRLALSQESLAVSRVDLVTHGVTVATEKIKLSGAQAQGFVHDNGLRKSLSQMGIVKDERYRRAMGLVEDASRKLLEDALIRARALAEKAGARLRDARLRKFWMPWVERSLSENLQYMFDMRGAAAPAPEAGGDSLISPYPEAKAGPEDQTFWLSVFMAVLREACLNHRIEMLQRKSGIPEMLWGAPVLLDTQGEPLALQTLDLQSRWLGYIPYLDDISPPNVLKKTAAWIIREPDLDFMKAFFSGDVRRLRMDTAADARVQPTLDEPNLLAKRPFRGETACGELGLSLSPHSRSSRIRWLRDGLPVGRSNWPLKSLRLEAVVDHPSLTRPPNPRSAAPLPAAALECLSAIAAAAPELYRRIMLEYRPEEASPRQAIIREHLLDLMVSGWDPKARDCPSHPWLAEVPLFREMEGALISLADLRANAAKGRRSLLCSTPHPGSLQHLTAGYPMHAEILFKDSDLVEGVAPRTPAPEPEDEAPPVMRASAKPAPPFPAVRPKPPAPEPPPVKPAEKIEDLAEGKTAPPPKPAPRGGARVAGLRRALGRMKKLNACPLPDDLIANLTSVSNPGGRLIEKTPEEFWALNLEHPLVREADRGAPETAEPYLLSILFTGLNRIYKDITDEADVRFSLALAESILEAPDGKD